MSGKNKKENKIIHDKRSNGARVPVQILVDYKSDGSYLFDFCQDIGKGGIFIETDSPLDVGKEIDLTFTIPDSKETISTKGKIIWKQEQAKSKDARSGMGIQFTSFSEADKKLLDDFVKRYSFKETA